MSDRTLRSRLIRLASENPELRSDLLPLLSKQAYSSQMSLYSLLAEAHRTFAKAVYGEIKKQLRDGIAVVGDRNVTVDLPNFAKGEPWGANEFTVFLHISTKKPEIWVYAKRSDESGSADNILVLDFLRNAKDVARRILMKLYNMAGRA